MKILLLSRYEHLGASSRYRSYLYLPYLRSRGHEITVSSLLSDRYVERMYLRKRLPIGDVVHSYFERMRTILSSKSFDLFWIEYEAFPWIPASLESLLLGSHVPYVVDYDDAVFHRYDLHRVPLVRSVLKSKIDAVMHRARAVIAGNTYIADRARLAGAQRVEIIPTVVDLSRYPVTAPPTSNIFTIGWVGSPITSRYLLDIQEVLRQICAGGGARMKVIGDTGLNLGDVPVVYVPWAEESEAHEIGTCDVGIMPLPDSPWERGKCGHKLIKYMACGRPVVASPVGINRSLVEDGVNGYLADSRERWVSALDTLRTDPRLRRRMGDAGRAKVEAEYAVQVTAPLLASILESAGRST